MFVMAVVFVMTQLGPYLVLFSFLPPCVVMYVQFVCFLEACWPGS